MPTGANPKFKTCEALGAKGKPIALRITVSVDVASLKQYAAIAEAAVVRTRTDTLTACAPMTERELIDRLLEQVQPSASGDCICAPFLHALGSCPDAMLVGARFIKPVRIYLDKWPSCFTQSSSKYRGFALG